MSDFYDFEVQALDGSPDILGTLRGKGTLAVNVASRCGYTPQYAALQDLYRELEDRNFAIVGFPCNQFGAQEPGTAEEIAEFCSATYGVSFPLMEKIEVNGDGRHAVYDELTQVQDASGAAGDIQWNFEKFLVKDGKVVSRFRPQTEPESPEVTSAIESALA